jgi:hypothetical protein
MYHRDTFNQSNTVGASAPCPTCHRKDMNVYSSTWDLERNR